MFFLLVGCLAGCSKYSSEYEIIEEEEGYLGDKITGFYRKNADGFRFDAVELEKRYAKTFAKIDSEVEEALTDHESKGRLGFVHAVWATKERLLLDRYNIEWRSPAELNPTVLFD